MKTTKQKQDWILENCVDQNGNIDLMDLDFRGKNVFLSRMKAEKIYQSDHKAKKVFQSDHEAEEIYQSSHEAELIHQYNHNANKIRQTSHTAGKVFEGEHTFLEPTKTFTFKEAIEALAEKKGIDKNKIEIK